jgi:hypothetical protein
MTSLNKLENIYIGGTKGKILTETVAVIFNKFKDTLFNFQKVDYDIMDIDEKDFDTDFI